MAGDEVVQLYISHLNATVPVPIRSLAGFKRISLQPGETKNVEFMVAPSAFSIVNNNGQREIIPGEFEISAGGGQPGQKGSSGVLTTKISVL